MGLEPETLLSGILRTLRGTLHECAEPAGCEHMTASVITSFLAAYAPDQLLTELGGHGVAAVFEGTAAGPTVLVRAELDGLPVEDSVGPGGAAFPYTTHRCGHDGHMTMVAGLAPLLQLARPSRGRVVLLFQPAEETGEGAQRVIDDPRFSSIHPDAALALHNLPGFPPKTVVLRTGTFSSASVGLRIDLTGTAAHAAEPEGARSPLTPLHHMIGTLPGLSDLGGDPYRLLTITHAQIGRVSYGITPGHATLCATLRSRTTAGLDQLRREVETLVHDAPGSEGLSVELRWLEAFPDTSNDPHLVATLREVCEAAGVRALETDLPFRWSEDFGHFANICPMVLFGLGIGEDAPGLHQPDYHFPDDVLQTGLEVFAGMVRSLTGDAQA